MFIVLDFSQQIFNDLHGLENVLNSAREITPEDGKLICLFGCGGDRDATKRPKMGAIAEKIAEIKGISSEEVENITTENAKKLFGICGAF